MAQQGAIGNFWADPDKAGNRVGYIEHQGNEVLGFREKPDLSRAKEFLQKGNFLWNSGMFCFTAGTYLEELQKYEPEVLEKSAKGIGTWKGWLFAT